MSPEENDMFEDIKSFIGESDNVDSNFIAPFPLLTKNAVEGLRYRAEVNIAFLYCIVSCNFLNLLCVKHLFMLTLLLWFLKKPYGVCLEILKLFCAVLLFCSVLFSLELLCCYLYVPLQLELCFFGSVWGYVLFFCFDSKNYILIAFCS